MSKNALLITGGVLAAVIFLVSLVVWGYNTAGRPVSTTTSSSSVSSEIFSENSSATESSSPQSSASSLASSSTSSQNQNSTAATKRTVKLYFADTKKQNQDCGASVAVNRTLTTSAVVNGTLQEMFKGPNNQEKSNGYQTDFLNWNQVYNGVDLKEDGTLIIDFKKEVTDPKSKFYWGNYSSSCGNSAWSRLKTTVKQFPTVKYVLISVDTNLKLWRDTMLLRGCFDPKTPIEKQLSPTELNQWKKGVKVASVIEIQKQCEQLALNKS